MDHVHALLIYSLWGAPVWAWLTVGALGAVEYALPRLKNPRARSVGELVANGLAKVLGRFPVIGPVLMALGTPQAGAATAKPDEPNPVAKVSALLPLLLLPALLLTGCDPTPAMLKGVALTSVAVAGGYKVVRTKDHETLTAITAEAKAGDKAKAQADLDAYLPKYATAEKALDGTTAALQGALDAIPTIQMAKDKAAVAQWLAKLAQLYADAVATAQAIGATLPKVVQ